jgi:hypothetical protein
MVSVVSQYSTSDSDTYVMYMSSVLPLSVAGSVTVPLTAREKVPVSGRLNGRCLGHHPGNTVIMHNSRVTEGRRSCDERASGYACIRMRPCPEPASDTRRRWPSVGR